jgi:thioredoxin reductase (NADPH)
MDEPARPAIVLVDDDQRALMNTGAELRRRYGADYAIVAVSSHDAAADELARMREAAVDVALVLAGVWLSNRPGSDLLNLVRGLHPASKRALLIDWGSWGHRPTAETILEAMATGRIDYYVLRPTGTREEQFHRIISEFLYEWAREHSPDAVELEVVGDPGAARTHEIRSLLRRSGVPHRFRVDESGDGTASHPPTLRMRDGSVLVDPSNEEIVAAFGVETEVDEAQFDLVVVGAGPAGLSAAVYASSEGIRTLVIERETIGGQAGSSSLIRNYLGFSRGVSGAELAQRAYQQAWVFGTRFAISREARSLDVASLPYRLTCDAGFEARGRAILLATGATYRRLGVPGLEALAGAGVYYGASTVEGLGLGHEAAYVVGGANAAGQAALHLARTTARVTLVVRGHSLAAGMSRYLLEAIEATPNLDVLTGTEIADAGGDGWLEWLMLRDRSGERRVSAAAVFVMIGARPRTEWLPAEVARDPSGHVLTGADALAADRPWPLERPPTTYETSVPGVFAVGDTRHRAVKRVASAVGEGSVAIPDVHAWLTESAAVEA